MNEINVFIGKAQEKLSNPFLPYEKTASVNLLLPTPMYMYRPMGAYD